MPEPKDGAQQKPQLAFAYRPQSAERVFAAEHFSALERICSIADRAPLQNFDDERARKLLAGTEILLTGWGCPRIDAAVLAAAPKLRLIAHAAGTVKAFVGPEVFEAGIVVTNAVVANAVPVAEFTLAAILLFNKRVLTFRDNYRRDRSKAGSPPLVGSDLGNFNKVIGIIGASTIGRRVIELLRPFDFTVLLSTPEMSPAEAAELGVELVSLDDLMARSDIASLHAPALPSTRQMIDARRLSLLRDGATFINTARGSIVEHAALERELVAGRINAVIDVTEPEVLPANSPLYELPNVLLTPHIAGAIGAERERLGGMAVAEIERFLRGERLQHAIPYDALERLA